MTTLYIVFLLKSYQGNLNWCFYSVFSKFNYWLKFQTNIIPNWLLLDHEKVQQYMLVWFSSKYTFEINYNNFTDPFTYQYNKDCTNFLFITGYSLYHNLLIVLLLHLVTECDCWF